MTPQWTSKRPRYPGHYLRAIYGESGLYYGRVYRMKGGLFIQWYPSDIPRRWIKVSTIRQGLWLWYGPIPEPPEGK